jgi:hypothetical protein
MTKTKPSQSDVLGHPTRNHLEVGPSRPSLESCDFFFPWGTRIVAPSNADLFPIPPWVLERESLLDFLGPIKIAWVFFWIWIFLVLSDLLRPPGSSLAVGGFGQKKYEPSQNSPLGSL